VTHREFALALRELAGGKYSTTRCEASIHEDGSVQLEWSAYVANHARFGWTERYPTPEQALDQIRHGKPEPIAQSLDEIGETPW
jgi:hypothetical protein